MREECKDLLSQLPSGDFAKVKQLYTSIKGDSVKAFVDNATDSQVDGIIKLCKKHLRIG